MKNAIKSVKDCFENDSVIITKIMNGGGKIVRIDAKTRFYKSDMNNFFSKWCSYKYADNLAREHYGKSLSKFNTFRY